MARKKKRGGGAGETGSWLVTFSDLMTLLLTFFVLLLTMASMDRNTIAKINPFKERIGIMHQSSKGKVSQRIIMVQKMIEDPMNMILERQRLKDLLFPDDVIPPDINRAELEANIKVLASKEGVALVLSDRLLFDKGQAQLSATALALLSQVRDLLSLSDSDVVISGFAEADEQNPEELAAERAMAVLMHMRAAGLPANRFAIAAYADRLDLALNNFPNRRVEIFIKTVRLIGGY